IGSSLPVADDPGEVGEDGGLLPERRKGGDRGFEELLDELARGRRAEERREVGAVGVALRVFPDPLGVSGQVEKIVGDLKGEAEVSREERQRFEGLLPRASGQRAPANRRHEERAGLARVDRFEVFERQVRGIGGQIRSLSGAAPLGADRAGQLLDDAGPGPGRSLRSFGGDLERPGDQRHGRELRRRDAADDVERGAASAAPRVVHGWQVVQDERRRVEKLDRDRDRARGLLGRANELAGGQHDERPQTLSRREGGVFDRARQSGRAAGRRRKGARKLLFEARKSSGGEAIERMPLTPALSRRKRGKLPSFWFSTPRSFPPPPSPTRP